MRSRADQVMVPHWLGPPVYMTMHDYCFPTTALTPQTRGMFVYHQWGFPQDLDPILAFCREHGLFCIEDCAHAFQSHYKGKRVGTFGDASVFSLAKFFPCVTGGAIYTGNPEIRDFIARALPEHDAPLARSVFRQRAAFDADPSPGNRVELTRDYAIYNRVLKIKPYALAVARSGIGQGLLHRRQSNYQILVQEFSRYDFVETLSSVGVTPWIFPMFLGPHYHDRIVKALTSSGIESGIYHFDVNRNLLNPDFRKCVAVPCHQGLSEDEVARIIGVVKGVL